MIKNRIVYLSTLIVLMALILIYEDTVTYVAFYTAVILPFISLFISIISKRNFSIQEQIIEPEIIKGNKTSYYVTIKNNSYLPQTSINVKFFETPYINLTNTEHFFSLNARKKYETSFEIEAEYVGLYELGIEKIVLYDFLGLFSFKQKHGKRLCLTVLPRILEVDEVSLKTVTEGIEQNRDLRAEEDYTIISDLRKYNISDGYKKIHWKASAKRNELISKNFGTSKKNSVTLILDTTKTSIQEDDEILETFVSILNYVSKNGFDIVVSYLNVPRLAGDFSFLYKQISKIKFDEESNFLLYLKDFIKMQIETDNLIIITKTLTDDLIIEVQNLQNNTLIYYIQNSSLMAFNNAKNIKEVIQNYA